MDDRRFDALARSLTDPRPRRGLGRLLGALALAGPLAAPGIETANAKKGKKNKKKKKKKQNNCGGQQCGGGTLCCGEQCISVLTDPANCGACGNACTPVDRCRNGVCERCPPGSFPCNGGDECIDHINNALHCGSCNNACAKYEVCFEANCTCPGQVCQDGFCCPAGYECVGAGGACCPTGYHTCNNGRCCPNGFNCGGTCGQECCKA